MSLQFTYRRRTIAKIPMSVDQLTWAFVDMTDKGGKLTLMWDTVVASVPFTVGP
jgi:hypothetical protein